MAYSLFQQKKATKIETLSKSRYCVIFQGQDFFLLYEKKSYCSGDVKILLGHQCKDIKVFISNVFIILELL